MPTLLSERKRFYFLEDDMFARGGQAIIFKGYDFHNGGYEHPLAVKFYHKVDRKEAAILTRREHDFLNLFKDEPMVINAVDFCENPAQPYLVMEYVPETLADRIATDPQTGVNRVTQTLIMDFCLQMAYFFQKMHQNDLVHLDLTPHNIGYDKKKRLIKVLDFGLALSPGTFLNISNLNPWAAYLSPEVRFEGMVTRTSDLYTIERTLEEMLLGRIGAAVPVLSERMEQQATQKALRDIEALFEKELPMSFKQLLLAMTADFAKRPYPEQFRLLIHQALREIDQELYFKPMNHNRIRKVNISSSFQTNPHRN